MDLRSSLLIFCGGLTPADFQTAFKRLEEQSRELEAAFWIRFIMEHDRARELVQTEHARESQCWVTNNHVRIQGEMLALRS
jgi:hypothetical protein